MNKYVKRFLHIGLIFSGLGPIVFGIIMLCISYSDANFNPTGLEIFKGIITTYIIAFVHAGSSVFPQIESWSKMKAMFFQGLCVYLVYLVGYLVNDWLPLSALAIGLYSACFIAAFCITWLIVYLIVNKATKQMNERIKKINETDISE